MYAKLQCAFVLIQYKLIVLLYKFKSKKIFILEKQKKQLDEINLFYFGGDELQDKSGFLQALQKYANVEYFTKEDGKYGSYNFGVLNRKKNIKKNRFRILEILKELECKPDIFLMQTWEWRIGLETLQEIKELYPKMLIVNIAMDDRHSFWIYGNKKIGSAGLIPALDTVFTTSSEAVSWYEKEGCSAFFYPLASDEDLFFPLEVEKIYDVGFVGAKYGIRETIVNFLEEENINVKAFGKGWESGRLPIDDTNKFYNQCKIVLGVGTILGCDKFVSMKLRDFDVPMSGSVYITNYNEDTANIFKVNKEILFYKTPQECVFQIKGLLKNNVEIQNIKEKALLRAKENTYTIRIYDMLTKLGYKI
jgi:spore maturation protein CgeB